MKKYRFFLAVLAIGAMLVACQKPVEEPGKTPDEQPEEPGGEEPGGEEPGGEEPGGETTSKGELQFLGNITDGMSFDYPADANASIDLGYWYAQIKPEGGEWQTMEANDPANSAYYKDIVFESSEPWCKVGYGAADGVINSTHWMLALEENTGDANRSATVTATFPDAVGDYVLLDGLKTRTITINQAKKASADEIVGEMTFKNVTSRGSEYKFATEGATARGLFYDAVQTRLTGSETWRTVEPREDAAFYQWDIAVVDNATNAPATWCQAVLRNNDTWVDATVEANTGAARSATVTITFPTKASGYQLLEGEAPTYSFVISQEAYVSVSYTTELWSGATIAKTWYSPAGWAGGLTPNVTLSADGKTFTSVIPDGIGGGEWMGQNFLLSTVKMEEGKLYKFSCKVSADAAGAATLKLALWNPTGGDDGKGGDTNEIFYANDVNVAAGASVSFERAALKPQINGDFRVVLIVDLGRSVAGSTWTVSEISLMSN